VEPHPTSATITKAHETETSSVATANVYDENTRLIGPDADMPPPGLQQWIETSQDVRWQRPLEQNQLLRAGFSRPDIWTQFKILSNRTFINFYRNPLLMMSHYLFTISFASESSHFLYMNLI
jgi:hypothetical protein